MRFKDVKNRAIQCIKTGHVRHEPREIEKNLFVSGELSADDVMKMIGSCRGDCYECRKHHFLDVDVHILRPHGRYAGFYLKFYFIEPDILFISVHRNSGNEG